MRGVQQQHVAAERDCDSIVAQQRRFFDDIRRKQLEVRAACKLSCMAEMATAFIILSDGG